MGALRSPRGAQRDPVGVSQGASGLKEPHRGNLRSLS